MCAVFELGQAVMQRKAAALLGGGCPAKKKAGSPPAADTLQVKAGISSSTIRRMQANESVSTNTLDTLCKFFGCEVDDIIKFQPDEK